MVKYRVHTPADRAFIRSAWSSSYKASHFAGMIDAGRWVGIMHTEIDALIDREHSVTIMAVDRADTFVYGFLSARLHPPDRPVVFYVYVKAAFRSKPLPDGTRSGDRIARGLFAAIDLDPRTPFLYACRTAVVAQLTSKIPRAQFVPATARYEAYDYATNHPPEKP